MIKIIYDLTSFKECKEVTASFDVDCQNSFTPLCPDELPVPDGHNIVDALNVQAQYAQLRIASKDWHPPDAYWIATDKHQQLTPISGYPNLDVYWNAHCIAGTYGAELLSGLPLPEQYDFMIYKGLEKHMHPYGACYHDLQETLSTGVIEFLLSKNIQNVIIGGLAGNFCVKTTAEQLARTGVFNVFINKKATRAL